MGTLARLFGLGALAACSARAGGGGGFYAPPDASLPPSDTPSAPSDTRPISTDIPVAPTDIPVAPTDAPRPERDAGPAPRDAPVSPGCPAWRLDTAGQDLALPPGFPAGAFNTLGRYSASCGGAAGAPQFLPTDVNGDGRLDLLVTGRCGAAPTGAWQAFFNDGASFGPSPRALALPGGLPASSFRDTFAGVDCAATPSGVSYTHFDIDADRRADLVVQAQCGDPTVGTSRWRVFTGTDDGFPAAQDFALTPAAAPALAALSAPRPCAGSGVTPYASAYYDVDGDGLPDIVEASACDDAAVGDTHWRVHRNVRTGYAAPTRLALPPGYGARAFAALAWGAAQCPSRPISALFTDIDGDRRRDLVVLRACADPALGQTYWHVHRNTGAGFTAAPERWPLPSGYPPGAIDFFQSALDCATRQGATAGLMDLDGDERPDLLLTTDCGDPAVGRTHWKVHRNTGSGFAAATRVELPARYPGADWRFASYGALIRCDGTTSSTGYDVTRDVDGDGARDLLVFTACADARVGTAVWRLHRGLCP